jgi:hypothetical protein
MPVIINEMVTEIGPQVVPAATAQPVSESMPVSQPEFELVQTISIMNERVARLQFD